MKDHEKPHSVKYINILGSAAHTYGNVLATMEKWVLGLFPENTFKTIHVNSKISHRQMLSTPHEFLKKTKPMIIFRPRIALDEDRFMAKTLIMERMSNIYNPAMHSELQPFFMDGNKKIAIKYTLNRYVMYIDVILIFNTLIQQINFSHFLKNAVPIGTPFDVTTFLESYISTDMMRIVSNLSGIPLKTEDGCSKPFLDYMNSNSCFPVTYKLQGSSGTDEYYRYYKDNILTILSDVSTDEGERVGQVMNSYQVTFTMKLEFCGTGFYYLFSDMIHDIPKPSIPDDSTLIPIYTDTILEEDLNLAPGWQVYTHFNCQLDKVRDTVDFSSTINQSIKDAICYHIKNGLPLLDLIDIKIRRQGILLQQGINYKIDYTNQIIYFNNRDYGFYTYKVIISINVLYINELIKEIHNLK